MASGDTLLIFGAKDYIVTNTVGATVAVLPSADTVVGLHFVLDFDPGANNEKADFYGIMPGQYDGSSAIEVVLHWSSDATTGNVKWDVGWKRITDDATDLHTETFFTIQSTTQATASAAGELQYTVIDFTNAQADGIQPGESFVLRIERDGADAGDTLDANDAELHGLQVRLN